MIQGSSKIERCLFVTALSLIVLALMRPGMVVWMEGSVLLAVSDAFRWIAVCASFLIYIRTVGADFFGCSVVLLGLFAFCSLWVNEAPMYYFIEFWLPSCAMALLARAGGGAFRYWMILSMLIVASSISIANLISVVVFPEGIPEAAFRYFNGNKNSAIMAILPSIFCSLLLDAEQQKYFSIRSAVLLAIGFVQITINEFAYSATSVVVLSLATVGVVLLVNKKARRIFNSYFYLIGYLVLFLALVVFRLQDWMSFLIEDVLGKTLTFTGRTLIWDQAISNVLNSNLLFGCGFDMYDVSGYVVGTAHNMVLETFVQGGVLGVLALVCTMVSAAHPLFVDRASRSAALVALAVACFMLIGLMEQIRFPAFFFFLGLAASWGPSKRDSGGGCRARCWCKTQRDHKA